MFTTALFAVTAPKTGNKLNGQQVNGQTNHDKAIQRILNVKELTINIYNIKRISKIIILAEKKNKKRLYRFFI